MNRNKLGIALGGGAARGWAHIGVLKALQQAGLAPDVVVGTSIGAVAGGCYVADRLRELEAFARALTRRRVFGYLDFNLAGSGLITGRRLCDKLDVHLEGIRIERLDKTYIAVATELGHGHEIWLSRGRLVDAMRASYALPGIFRPVKINDCWLIDGALVNPIPVSVCRARGARLVIAVNLNADIMGRGTVIPDQAALGAPDDTREVPPTEVSDRRSALHLLHRQFFGKGNDAPGISNVMYDAFNITQDRIARARLAGDPPDVTICPRVGHIRMFDFHRAAEAIREGEAATLKMIDEIREAVARLPKAAA